MSRRRARSSEPGYASTRPSTWSNVRRWCCRHSNYASRLHHRAPSFWVQVPALKFPWTISFVLLTKLYLLILTSQLSGRDATSLLRPCCVNGYVCCSVTLLGASVPT